MFGTYHGGAGDYDQISFVNDPNGVTANLATGTAQWWANGRFWGWEGVGCCAGTCTHVWNYSHAEARLFPELALSTRVMQDLGVGFEEETTHYLAVAVRESVVNAMKHGNGHDQSKRVKVQFTLLEQALEVRVQDEGPGIPAEHFGRIFSRFFTYRPGESNSNDHTGLGLALVRAIVESYGGSVQARARKDGGSEFIVTLPRATT